MKILSILGSQTGTAANITWYVHIHSQIQETYTRDLQYNTSVVNPWSHGSTRCFTFHFCFSQPLSSKVRNTVIRLRYLSKTNAGIGDCGNACFMYDTYLLPCLNILRKESRRYLEKQSTCKEAYAKKDFIPKTNIGASIVQTEKQGIIPAFQTA